MSKRANPTAVGAFVLAALALVVVGIVVLGGLQLFKKEWPFVMFFEGSLTGLDEGSPVVIRGVKIGTVSRIRLFATAPGQEPLIGVYVNIDPSLLPKGGEVQGEKRELAIADLIKQGLRAQLQTQSLLTGQLLVYLDFFPDFPAVFARRDPTVQEIPTIPTTLARLQARLEALLDTIGKVNLNELTVAMTEALRSTRALVNSPEVKSAIVSANQTLQSADVALKNADHVIKGLDTKIDTLSAQADATLGDVRRLIGDAQKSVAKLDAQIEPLSASIQGAGDSARQTLRSVDKAVDGDSPLGYELVRALRDVADAARSLKALADYLERHPDSLLRGKGGPESK